MIYRLCIHTGSTHSHQATKKKREEHAVRAKSPSSENLISIQIVTYVCYIFNITKFVFEYPNSAEAREREKTCIHR